MTRHGARSALLVFTLVTPLALTACSGRRLPPGTPAPEYEAPLVPAWGGGEQADAAVPASPTADASLAPESAAGAELSPDAGVR